LLDEAIKVQKIKNFSSKELNFIADLTSEKSKLMNLKSEEINLSLNKYYDKSAILILPSYSEAFPLVILEAMARGLVILVSDLPGMREIVEEGRNGYLFNPGDLDKIEDLIFHLKNNKNQIKKISKNNLQDVHKFTSDILIPKYIKIYEDIVYDV